MKDCSFDCHRLQVLTLMPIGLLTHLSHCGSVSIIFSWDAVQQLSLVFGDIILSIIAIVYSVYYVYSRIMLIRCLRN